MAARGKRQDQTTRIANRRGRAARPAPPGARPSLGLKVTPEVKNKLDAAAKQNGRTQSQEAEQRLERSFQQQDLLDQVMGLAYGREFAGLLMTVGRAMLVTGQKTALDATYSFDEVERWLTVPYA